jgi:hypothetical protein
VNEDNAEDSVMADRWMDERDRDWRDRDWRRSEAYGRGGDERGRPGRTPRWGEDRTWSGPADDERGPYESGARNRQDYEGGENYGGRTGSGEGYGRTSGRPGYEGGPGQRRYGEGVRVLDYTGRNYADEAGRTDYGYAGGRDYGRGRYGAAEERGGGGYVGGRDEGRAWGAGEDRSYDRYGAEMRRRASASYGEDDERRAREEWEARNERGRGEGPGDFLQRAGERISSWFRGGREEDERGERGERRYREDWGREARAIPDRGHRGVGPKGYRRSDERISDEVHERLTDDPWLDASAIQVEVRDGEVSLSGHVENREAKHRAERLVEDLSGVRHVQNNLRVDPDRLTGAGRGYGSSALEAEMRRNAEARNPGNEGASGASGRTSTGAEADRSSGATGSSVDPKTGLKQ